MDCNKRGVFWGPPDFGKLPTVMVQGPKSNCRHGNWDLIPPWLLTWTLRVRLSGPFSFWIDLRFAARARNLGPAPLSFLEVVFEV